MTTQKTTTNKTKKNPCIRHSRQRGFSLIELMVVLFILTLVMGVVFTYINTLQKRYRTEETKLDLSQEAREVMTSLVRDLHTAGFPNQAMYSPGTLMSPPESDDRNAIGLVALSATQIWFEGDLEGNGTVRNVRYTLVPGAGGDCPCLLRRSEVQKVNATAPWDHGTNFTTVLSTIINSGGSGAGGPNGSRNIAGNSIMPNGSAVANNTLFAAYRPTPVFQAFTATGAPVTLPLDATTTAGRQALGTVRTIRITLNVLAGTADMDTNLRPVMSLTSHARMKN